MTDSSQSLICADDDRITQRLYQRKFEQAGFAVRICEDGESVLAEQAAQPADLLVLDINMDGMSGLEVCRTLRQDAQAFNVPIILVSAEESEQAIIEGLSVGADDYIVKPVKMSELIAKVRMQLRRKEMVVARDLGLSIGSVFSGRYQIEHQIGTGGSSRVYLAVDVTTEPQKQVALKIFDLPPSRNQDSAFQTRFLREACEHARLDHPSIVRFHDFGHAAGYYYLAMEYVAGVPISVAVHEHGPMSSDDLLVLAGNILSALVYMERSGLVHRDIKPENIMQTEEGYVLLDFGLARMQTDHTLSSGSELRCTPLYAAPECLTGEVEPDIRGDLYSLGLTLHFASTGELPIPGTSTMDMIRNQVEFVPPSLTTLRPDLPPLFACLVDRMIAKDRNLRPAIFAAKQMVTQLFDAHKSRMG